MAILNFLNGSRTYLAAAALLGLAIFQATQGDYSMAIQSVLAGLAAAGLRSDMTQVNS